MPGTGSPSRRDATAAKALSVISGSSQTKPFVLGTIVCVEPPGNGNVKPSGKLTTASSRIEFGEALTLVKSGAGAPETIVEIGPGQGALTEYLLRGGAHVHAIELDPAMVERLARRFPDHPRLTVHPADVLDVDLAQWGPAALAGNLPYYITSPILERIRRARTAIASSTVTFSSTEPKRIAFQISGSPSRESLMHLA